MEGESIKLLIDKNDRELLVQAAGDWGGKAEFNDVENDENQLIAVITCSDPVDFFYVGRAFAIIKKGAKK